MSFQPRALACFAFLLVLYSQHARSIAIRSSMPTTSSTAVVESEAHNLEIRDSALVVSSESETFVPSSLLSSFIAQTAITLSTATTSQPPPTPISSSNSTSSSLPAPLVVGVPGTSLPPAITQTSASFLISSTTLSISGLSTISQTTTTLPGQNTPTILPIWPCLICSIPGNVIIPVPVPPLPPPGFIFPPPPGQPPIQIGTNGIATPQPTAGPGAPTVPNPDNPNPTSSLAPDGTASTLPSSSISSQSSATSPSSSSSTSSSTSLVTVSGADAWPAVSIDSVGAIGQAIVAYQSSILACNNIVGLFSLSSLSSCASGGATATPHVSSTAVNATLQASSTAASATPRTSSTVASATPKASSTTATATHTSKSSAKPSTTLRTALSSSASLNPQEICIGLSGSGSISFGSPFCTSTGSIVI